MSLTNKVLVVEDDSTVRGFLTEALSYWGYQVGATGTGRGALDLLSNQLFDAVLCDIRMPDMDGIELLRQIKRHDPSVEVLMITGFPMVNTAVEALKLGAYDYITKPLTAEDLRSLMGQVMRRHSRNGSRLEKSPAVNDLVGASPQMERIREMIVKVAAVDSPVLIEGESGTGKELAAAALHRLSLRSSGPFVPVNCSAIPADLLESELFGHTRGAFSGAVADTPGLFRSADGGTMFLDEVTELPPALQVKLLRVLQDLEIRPVGSARSHAVDVRILAATNRRLTDAVKDGSLRDDLFYRLDVVRIEMPPLRERRADIPILVDHFLRQLNQHFDREVTGLVPEAMAALTAYDFPGNVRELANLLERAYALGARGEIVLADLPALSARPRADARFQELPTLAQAERELIIKALRLHDNNKGQAARALGISRQTLYRRLKEYSPGSW